jgi:glutamine amidotransferase
MRDVVRVAVLDYGAANMVSITRALAAVGAAAVVAADPTAMAGADALVVPGVGAAGSAMNHIRERGLLDPVRNWVRAGRSCLGICLGFQLLFDASDEGEVETLGLLAGRTIGLADAPTLPHIGWNSVDAVREHPLFDGIADGTCFYFVHSFAPAPADERVVLAVTRHGRPFVSAVAQGSLFGVQFHPEKSSDAGLRVLANFVGLVAAHRAPVAGGASMAGGAHSESGASTGGREPAGTVRMA